MLLLLSGAGLAIEAGKQRQSSALYFLSASEQLMLLDLASHIAHPLTQFPIVKCAVAPPTNQLLLLTDYRLFFSDERGANLDAAVWVLAADYVTAFSFAPDG